MGDAQHPKGGCLVFAHAFLVVEKHRGGNARLLAHDPAQGCVQAAPHPARSILRAGALRGVSYLHAPGNGDTEGHPVFQHPLAEVEPGRAAPAVGDIDPPLKVQLRAVVQLRRLLLPIKQGAVGAARNAFAIQPNVRQGKGQTAVRTQLWLAVNNPGDVLIRARQRRGRLQPRHCPQQPQRRRAQHQPRKALPARPTGKQKQTRARRGQRPWPRSPLKELRCKTTGPKGRAQRQHPAAAFHGRDAGRPHGVCFCIKFHKEFRGFRSGTRRGPSCLFPRPQSPCLRRWWPSR